MFDNFIKEALQTKLSTFKVEEIEQDLINSLYTPINTKKFKGGVNYTFLNNKESFKEVLLIGNHSNTNSFFLCSKYSKYDKSQETKLLFSFKNPDLIDVNIMEALNKISTSFDNSLPLYKAYKNLIISNYMNVSDQDFISNYYFSYLVSFASSSFLILRKHYYLMSKISNLVENQISNLPTELSIVEEMKIVNKIADYILTNLTVSKKTPSFIVRKSHNNLSEEQLSILKKNMNSFFKKMIYSDLIFKKNIAIAKYIIPFLIKKVKLSDNSINRFISLCQEHLIDIMRFKIEESEELDLSLLNPFIRKNIFVNEVGSNNNIRINIFNILGFEEENFLEGVYPSLDSSSSIGSYQDEIPF
jgi:hypothetical protein